MMYISVFPVAISVRRTNVYEEKSLGIYAADEEGTPSFVGICSLEIQRCVLMDQQRIYENNLDLIYGIFFWDFL